MPEISVIVPVYQVENYLERCVSSILAQTFADFEMILVDDGSTDKSGALCDAWREKDPRIRVIHKENGGASSARNAGLKVAQGAYIGFVDSDDWIHPQMYEKLYDMLRRHPECDIAECALLKTSGTVRELKEKSGQEYVLDKKGMLDYFFRLHGEASNVGVWKYLLRRSLLSGFSFIEGTITEDFEASLEFFLRARAMARTNKVLYYYYNNPVSVTTSRFTKKDLDYLRVWDRILERAKIELPDYVQAAENYRSRANFTMLSKMFLRGYDKSDAFLNRTRKELKNLVRKDYVRLWRMLPMSRKVLLTLLAILP